MNEPTQNPGRSTVAENVDVLQAAIGGQAFVRRLGSAECFIPLDDLDSQEQIDTYLESMLAGYRELPSYELLMLADTATSDEQIVRVGLVFPEVEDAEIAADILLDRLDAYVTSQGRTLKETLGSSSTRYYVRDILGRAVLVMEFATPKLSIEEIAEDYDSNPSTVRRSVYRQLMSMFYGGITGWVSTATRSEVEALR